MKLNLKMIAAAAALAAAGSAHADLTGYNTGNGSLSVYAFNTSTRAYYILDLGVLMNSFLPNSITTGSGDGGVTGTRTPEAGTSFSASGGTSFTNWLEGQTTSFVRWAVVGGDSLSNSATDLSRLITSSTAVNPTLSNGNLTNATGGSNLGNLAGLAGTFTGSTSAINGAPGYMDSNGLVGAGTLATLDSNVGLYYFTRTAATGASATSANRTAYSNSLYPAVVSFSSTGDFTYSLASAEVAAVPIPAAAWLLGTGLLAMGGAARRRKAAAQA